MSEEIGYILEMLSFKTSIYRDKSKRNLTFNDDEYYANVLNEYINKLQQENQQLKSVLNEVREKLDKISTKQSNNFDLVMVCAWVIKEIDKVGDK